MTSNISNSAIRARVLSWSCALIALIFVFGVARLAMNRLPFIALLAVAGFKYASMFYVAGRLIEQMWRYASKAATGFLVGTRSGQLAAQQARAAAAQEFAPQTDAATQARTRCQRDGQ